MTTLDFPIRPRHGTQTELVLRRLERGPLCASEIYQHTSPITHRLAARIHDLRTRYGYVIESGQCELKYHTHQSPVAAYRLVK